MSSPSQTQHQAAFARFKQLNGPTRQRTQSAPTQFTPSAQQSSPSISPPTNVSPGGNSAKNWTFQNETQQTIFPPNGLQNGQIKVQHRKLTSSNESEEAPNRTGGEEDKTFAIYHWKCDMKKNRSNSTGSAARSSMSTPTSPLQSSSPTYSSTSPVLSPQQQTFAQQQQQTATAAAAGMMNNMMNNSSAAALLVAQQHFQQAFVSKQEHDVLQKRVEQLEQQVLTLFNSNVALTQRNNELFLIVQTLLNHQVQQPTATLATFSSPSLPLGMIPSSSSSSAPSTNVSITPNTITTNLVPINNNGNHSHHQHNNNNSGVGSNGFVNGGYTFSFGNESSNNNNNNGLTSPTALELSNFTSTPPSQALKATTTTAPLNQDSMDLQIDFDDEEIKKMFFLTPEQQQPKSNESQSSIMQQLLGNSNGWSRSTPFSM